MKLIIHLNPSAVAATLGINAELLKTVRTAFDKPSVVRDYGNLQIILGNDRLYVRADNPLDAMALVVKPIIERLEHLGLSSREKLLHNGNPIFQIDSPDEWDNTLVQTVPKHGKHWLGRFYVPKVSGVIVVQKHFQMWQTVGVVNNGSTNEGVIAAITQDGHDCIYRVCSDRSHQLIRLSEYRLYKLGDNA